MDDPRSLLARLETSTATAVRPCVAPALSRSVTLTLEVLFTTDSITNPVESGVTNRFVSASVSVDVSRVSL